jgi:hypothetical protein
MNFWAEGTAASPKQVIDKLAVDVPPGGDRNDQPLDAGGPVQIAGYRYQSYSPLTAQLLIALQGPEGKVAAVATTMTWTGTDWRFRYPSSGTPAMELLGDLSGYVQWSAF